VEKSFVKLENPEFYFSKDKLALIIIDKATNSKMVIRDCAFERPTSGAMDLYKTYYDI
jgi:hypothetical protein